MADDEKKETKKTQGTKIKKSPAELARRRFKRIERRQPRRAKMIKGRISGEIYGLYPTVVGYASDIVVDVFFKEGEYQYGLD